MSTVAVRGVVAGTLIIAITILPMALCGVLIVELSSDLGLSNDGLGIVFAVFFGSAALSSSWLGRFSERVGPRAALRLGALAVAAATLLIASVVRHWTALIPLIVVIGTGSALTRPAAGLWIAHVIPRHRQGLAFGVSQTSVLVAMLVAGIAVPTVALPFGWRVTFLLAAALALLAVFAVPSRRSGKRTGAATSVSGREQTLPADDLPRPTLVLLAVAAALGTAGASSLGAFTMPTLIATGVETATAGSVVAASSVVGLVSRVGVGFIADRRASIGLSGTAVMLLLGAGAFVLLGAPATWLVVLAVPLAYATAWSWLGLFTLAILRLNPHAPGSAIGTTQAGPFVGGVVGPLATGILAERLSFQVAWGLAAVLSVASGLGVLAIHRRLRPQVVGSPSRC